MIANERQYRIAKAELRRFGEALEPQKDYAPSEGVDPRMGNVMADALAGQAETLWEEVQRYEDLRDGRVSQREIEGFLGLLQALVEARIAAGLTQEVKETDSFDPWREELTLRESRCEWSSVAGCREWGTETPR